MRRTYTILTLSPLVALFCITWLSGDAEKVERHYSGGIYPVISGWLRSFFAVFPVSVGDLIYGILILLMVVMAVRTGVGLITGRFNRRVFFARVRWLLPLLLLVYLLFTLFWGINYRRSGLASQLGLDTSLISHREIYEVDCLLLDRVNRLRSEVDTMAFRSRQELFQKAYAAYDSVSLRYPFLKADAPLLRSSLWSPLGDYLGFMGYYNPFTGEAQVNTGIPDFLLPYTACHELAHQLGYAKENEANMAGYLAAASSTDPRFLYSVYLDLFLYVNRDLHQMDSTEARRMSALLSDQVKGDLRRWRVYSGKQDNRISAWVGRAYENYLRSHGQPRGLKTYSEVSRFVIAYRRKFGSI